MKYVIEKELWADLIIFSFPLYYFSVPGILKNLIDRQLPMVLPFMSDREDGVGSGSHDLRYDMSRKKYVLVSTCGFYSAEKNYDSVLGMFDHICGKDNYESIFCGQGELFSVKELALRIDEYLQIVETAGEEYATGMISKACKNKLKELLFPKDVFEKMADASWGISKETGEKESESLIFTRQMAALYNKQSYDGKDRVLEICYTDLGETYQLVLTKDGCEVVKEGQLKYTTRIDTPYDVWVSIAQNEIRGDEALMKQMYRVSGDFSLMIQWNKYFGGVQEEENLSKQDIGIERDLKRTRMRSKPPAMTTMLLAWISIWVFYSIDAVTGPLISLVICACIPTIMLQHELIFYDKLSLMVVALLNALAMGTGESTIVVTISYLLFGGLWLGSCFTKEPLCACYVKYSYGGEDALNNPIFMKTNYILAAAWGVLYIVIAVLTFILSKTAFIGSVQLLSNILPAIMGVFTVWFQKWYPAWIAKGRKK